MAFIMIPLTVFLIVLIVQSRDVDSRYNFRKVKFTEMGHSMSYDYLSTIISTIIASDNITDCKVTEDTIILSAKDDGVSRRLEIRSNPIAYSLDTTYAGDESNKTIHLSFIPTTRKERRQCIQDIDILVGTLRTNFYTRDISSLT